MSVLIHSPLSQEPLTVPFAKYEQKKGVGTREDEPCEQSPFDLPRKVEKMEGLFSQGRRGKEYAHDFYAARLNTTYINRH